MKESMKASAMSRILFGVLGLLIVMLVGGSFLAASLLSGQSKQAGHAQIDADVSADEGTRLEQLSAYLQTNAAGIAQTATIAESIGQYNQSTIVATLTGYAKEAGVTIGSLDFTSSTGTTSAGSVQVTLNSPLPYHNLIIFIQLLEHGLMPAQILAADIAADPDTSDNVTISVMVIKVGA